MTEVSSTTTASCPVWCKYTADEHARHDGTENPPFHGSARIGMFQFWQIEGQPIVATVNRSISGDDDLTSVALRELAAGAVAAAEWIELYQSTAGEA